MADAAARPKWLEKQEAANEKAAQEAFEATFGKADDPPAEEEPDEDDDDDDEDEDGQPLGPLSAERCSVSGKGFSGGEAGAVLKLTVTAKDDSGRRITWGGAKVAVEVTRSGSAAEPPIAGEVTDGQNGEYFVTYTASEKGNYMIKITMNGSPVGGSPFPVYISPATAPEAADPLTSPTGTATTTAAAAAAAAAAVTAAAPAGALPALPLPGAAAPGVPDFSALLSAQTGLMTLPQAVPSLALPGAFPGVAGSIPNFAGFAGLAGMMPGAMGLGGLMTAQTLDQEIYRTIHVGNLTPFIQGEQLRMLFSAFGNVTDVRMAGESNQYAFVEFTSPEDATKALAMNGQMLGDRNLRVEISKTARLVKPGGPSAAAASAANAQLQQLALQQLQQQQLAMQVAAMRVKSKEPPAAPQRPPESAAKAAAARLSRRLGQEEEAEKKKDAGEDDSDRHRSSRRRSRSRSRSRDRHRRRRSRSKSRDRDRRRRSRSRDRDREGSRRERHHRSRSRDRKERHRSRSRDRDRKESKHKSSRKEKSEKS